MGALIYLDPETGDPVPVCSGTLIHERYFLTAEHCTDYLEYLITSGLVPFDNVKVNFNPNGYEVSTALDVINILTHPDYGLRANANLYDVGVLELAEPVSSIEPAQLPPLAFLNGLK